MFLPVKELIFSKVAGRLASEMVFNKIAILPLWLESLKNICKRVQFLSKLLGEGNCNWSAIAFGNKHIIRNAYHFLKIEGDEEDIKYEDETEEKEKEEDASEN